MSAQTATLKAIPAEPAEGPTRVPVPAPSAAVHAAIPSRKERIRKALIGGAALAVLVTASWYGWDYWRVGRFLVSTDDAYVKADSTIVSPGHDRPKSLGLSQPGPGR